MSTSREVSHVEAKQIALRLIAGSFRRDGERLDLDRRPRFSIPTRVNDDDDCLLIAYIEQNARLAATPKAGVDREVIARIIDPAVFNPGYVEFYPDRSTIEQYTAFQKADAILALPSVLGGVDQPSSADGRQCNEQSGQSLSPAWQPIETAPRDRRIMYHNGKTTDAIIGYCRWSVFSDDDLECWWDYERDDEACPKFWMDEILLPPQDTPPPDNAGLVSGGGR